MVWFAVGVLVAIAAFKILVGIALIFGLPTLLFGSYVLVLLISILCCIPGWWRNRKSNPPVSKRNRSRLANRWAASQKAVSSYFWDDDSL